MKKGTILLRAMRRAAWLEEAKSVEEFVRFACFTKKNQPDLDLSVYEVNEDEVLQATVEHAASYTKPEERAGLAIDPEDAEDLRSSLGKSQVFAFVRMRHRSIGLLDEAALCALMAKVFPALDRHRRFSEEELGRYVAMRLDDGDDEWLKHCGTEKHRTWGELASQFRAPARSGAEDTQTSLEAIFERTQSGPTSPPPDAAPGRAPLQASDE
jgi:hypothetical protein